MLYDLVLSVIIWLMGRNLSFFQINLSLKEAQLGILSNIISTDVSLAGFILAALTIIVTFKSNIKVKSMDDASDSLELIFSSKHYPKIKRVFKLAIVEFCVLFVFLYCVWLLNENIELLDLSIVNVCALITSALIVLRTLAVLFYVIDLDERKI